LKECLSNGETLYCQDDYGNTALHMACANGMINIVQYILEFIRNDAECPFFLNQTNENGSTALHWAALNGNDQIVKLLVDAGAKINLEDHQGKSAYYYAEQHHHEAVMEVLLTTMEQRGMLYEIEPFEENEEDPEALMTIDPTSSSKHYNNEEPPEN
jgi:ankyrin repeat protein